MAKVEQSENITELQKWAMQAIDLLDEVKPYRSVFYKQRVAKLKNEFANITQTHPSKLLQNKG
jgi:3-methyladenine DNA glycosylase AlkC